MAMQKMSVTKEAERAAAAAQLRADRELFVRAATRILEAADSLDEGLFMRVNTEVKRAFQTHNNETFLFVKHAYSSHSPTHLEFEIRVQQSSGLLKARIWVFSPENENIVIKRAIKGAIQLLIDDPNRVSATVDAANYR